MQRENHILNLKQKRSGFAMMMAIFVIVIMGTLMALMISMSATSLKRTTNIYLSEQAVLLARSATEYALLAISGTDRTDTTAGGCITSINSSYNPEGSGSPMFNINTTIQYIGLSGGPGANECTTAQNYIQNAAITNSESLGSALIDVTVTSDSSLGLGETIRYHRRTLQKL